MTAPQSADPLDSYRRSRDGAVAALAELRTLLESGSAWHDVQTDRVGLDQAIERLRDGRFVLAVVGEFSSGKSFLLNALLGKVRHEERLGARRITGLLATDINPSTATVTELVFSSDETATAYYSDGREERIPLERLARFVAVGDEAKLHDATGDETGSPVLVRVGVDSAFLANGFVVADTPGLASINPAHRRATLTYLPGADAVLYLVDTQQPFSDGDASFLGIVRQYLESIFIVQTKIDLWRMRDGEREIWQSAADRIVAQAVVHAPGVPTFPVSARDYAEGLIDGDLALTAQSRFPALLAALDASLVATTGRARLRRAATEARRLAKRAADALALDAAALEMDETALRERRETLLPALDAVSAAATSASRRLEEAGTALRDGVLARGATMREDLLRSLARTFDTADIARLRDRAKLHIIVDGAVASAIGEFATTIGADVAGRLHAEADGAVRDVVSAAHSADEVGDLGTTLATLGSEVLPLTDEAAHAFGADCAGGAWSAGVESGLRSTIVLGALSGPAVGLVSAIAGRFAAAPHGTYMKRELLADLNAALFAGFDAEIAAFVAVNAERIANVARRLGQRVGALADRVRGESLAAVERALTAREAGVDLADLAEQARRRQQRFDAIAARIEAIAESFGARAPALGEWTASPTPRIDRTTAVVPRESVRFDPQTYEHGLRPERWRVAILGGLRRGKSSLINAVAGERVLGDEGGDVEMHFPVHVRYGPASKAYALGDDAAWDPVPLDTAVKAATRTPVLIETPWSLPRQLVLVHVPPFDSGQPDAERIAFAAARSASELVALFSRQLSEREIEVYGRTAQLGKAFTFVHTIADNEAATERRNVVMLAERYLRERAIVPQRIFTISTHEYRSAREAGRAPAAWNELDALIGTLTAHAQEHMARLERSERERAALERLADTGPRAVAPSQRRPSLLGRLFGQR